MAKIRAIGADVQLLWKMESTYGVIPAATGPAWRSFLASRFAGGGSKGLGYEPELGLGADSQDPFYDAQNVDLEFETHMRVKGVGSWLKRLLGAPATTGPVGGLYTHVFSSGADIPSFSVEEGWPGLTTARYYQRLGVKMNQLTIPFARMGPARATWTAIGQQLTKTTSSQGGTFGAALTGSKWFMNAMTLKKDSATFPSQLVGGNLVFSNNVTRVETIGRGDGLIEGADEGDRTANGTLEIAETADITLWTAAMTDESAWDFKVKWTTPALVGASLEFHFGRVFASWAQMPVNNPHTVSGPIAWRAAKDGSNAMCIVTLINDQASYAADDT